MGTFGFLMGAAALNNNYGPFTPDQLYNEFPPRPDAVMPHTVETITEDLQLLAEMGFIEVEYLA